MSRSSEFTIRGLVAALLVLLPSVAQSQTGATYLKPDFGNAYVFSPLDAKSVAVAVPVTAEPGVDAASLSVAVSDVAVAAQHDSKLLDCFHAALKTPPGATLQIVITATCPSLRPLAYTVTLVITKATPASPSPQRLALQITAPSGELRPIPAQTIDRFVYCIGGCNADPPSLIVMETSGRTMLTDVKATQSDPMLSTDGSPLNGRIGSTATNIPAGEPAPIPLILSGDFPLGKAKTTVAVTARQLAAPAFVPFEIRTRMHEWLLLPTVLAGVLLGFLLRVTLKRWIERGTAKIAALDLLQTMETRCSQESDPELLNEIHDLSAKLEEAVKAGDSAAITQLRDTTDAAFATALNDLQIRIVAVSTAIAETAKQTGRAPRLPAEVAAPLIAAGQSLGEIRKLVAARNAFDANEHLANINSNLAFAVEGPAAQWRDALQRAVDGLAVIPPLPPPRAAVLTAAKTAIDAQLAAFPTGKNQADLAAILDAIETLRSIAVHGIVARILQPAADDAQRVVDRLKKVGADPSSVTAAIERLRSAISEDDSGVLEKPVAALRTLLEAMRKAILDSTADNLREKVTELLNGGDYETAVGYQGKALGQVTGAATPSSSVLDLTNPAPSASTPVEIAPSVATHYPVASVRAHTWWEVAAAKATQSVAIAILISFAGLLALAPNFDGTWRGLLTALFWGYASDISADALTQKTK